MCHTLLSLLACPACAGGSLTFSEGGEPELRCADCGVAAPVRLGVPDFTRGARPDGGRWTEWEDHLQGFADRRHRRARKPNRRKLERWRRKERAFLAFIDPAPGRVLDVGCGPGSLRKGLPPPRHLYTGIDPLPPDARPDFDRVCGLAERLPFREGVFSAVIVRSALDHFCEPERFFEEAWRVLTPGGRLYIEQAVHECRGPLGLCRWTAHAAQDAMDRLRQKRPVEKHMNDFTRREVMDLAPVRLFRPRVSRRYVPDPLAATQWFAALERVS